MFIFEFANFVESGEYEPSRTYAVTHSDFWGTTMH